MSAIILGATVLVRADPTNERTAKTVSRIVQSAQRATRLVGDLLDFSQAKMGGGIPLTRQAADIHDLARQVVDEFGTAHPNRTIVLEHHGMGEGMWDADRIVQVISNLLGNALSHSPGSAPVQVTSRAEHEHVTIEVRNVNRDGPIPAALLPVLFDPFKRGTQHCPWLGSRNGSS